MKDFKKNFKDTENLVSELRTIKVNPKKETLISITSGFLMIVVIIPFYLIMLELFRQNSPVTWVYKLLVVIFFILVLLVCPLYSTINLLILKYYTEKEELQNINGFYLFLVELTRISTIITSVVIASILTFLLCKFTG
ncbi:MAG: hypothetical protein SOZ32_07535 [Bacilli bacterium]|nr:hypothetical protein [Mollicutes bacterium]MDY3900035.1 hypothetical protein [Bacilli bacterium]